MSNYKEESFDVIDDDNTEKQIQQKIRVGFIRKVYGIILFQLLITTIVIYFAVTLQNFQQFILSSPGIVYLCLAGVIFTEIPIMCCQSVAQAVPFNYILLIIFTLCESYLLAYTTIYYEPLHVLICAGITLAIVIGLTLALVHIFGLPFTGTSVNPARSIGPALFTGETALSNVWVFIVGPLVGGILAALLYRFVLEEKEAKTPVKAVAEVAEVEVEEKPVAKKVVAKKAAAKKSTKKSK